MHPPDHGLLAADVAHKVDGTVHQHPPEVRVFTLVEQVDAGLDAHLGASLDQFRQLLVTQTIEDAERAEVGDAHQIVAR